VWENPTSIILLAGLLAYSTTATNVNIYQRRSDRISVGDKAINT